jgi:hypothetical protein
MTTATASFWRRAAQQRPPAAPAARGPAQVLGVVLRGSLASPQHSLGHPPPDNMPTAPQEPIAAVSTAAVHAVEDVTAAAGSQRRDEPAGPAAPGPQAEAAPAWHLSNAPRDSTDRLLGWKTRWNDSYKSYRAAGRLVRASRLQLHCGLANHPWGLSPWPAHLWCRHAAVRVQGRRGVRADVAAAEKGPRLYWARVHAARCAAHTSAAPASYLTRSRCVIMLGAMCTAGGRYPARGY